MTILTHWLRNASIVVALLCLLGIAEASPEEHTDAAFAAILADSTRGWLIPEQMELAPADENELIARLRRLKKAGANFNAFRHRGTLLAHAIRAGQDRTAVWLLHNGSDPKRVLFDDSRTAYDLARLFNRPVVIRVLEREYGFVPPSPSVRKQGEQSKPTPIATPKTPLSRKQQAIYFLTQPRASPSFPSVKDQKEWQTLSAALSREEYASIFYDGVNLNALILMVKDVDGGIEQALSRLPLELVRQHAQQIAGLLAEWSAVTYYDTPKISYSNAARSWNALWGQIDQPLNYDKWPDLAGRIPPTLWPGLFASGYTKPGIEVTGCLLSAVDTTTLKELWPNLQRFFIHSHEEAPALVLAKYRLDQRGFPCYYSSSPAETVAKLTYLREQGVTSPVTGLRQSRLTEAGNPALMAIAANFTPKTKPAPRIVAEPLACELVLNDVWLNALVNPGDVGWGIPAAYVQAIDVPGQSACGFIVSGDAYPEDLTRNVTDNFFDGPIREGSTRCADQADDGDIWIEASGQIRRTKLSKDRCDGGCALHKVLDKETGKRYWLNDGERGSQCSLSWELPDAYEWKISDSASSLVLSSDNALMEGLLRAQCEEWPEPENKTRMDLHCRGLASFNSPDYVENPSAEKAMTALRQGEVVFIKDLVDKLGAERRAAYATAIASRDRAQIQRLHTEGIPAWWTADEIRALGKAKLPLAEKRSRIALLFANADQLGRTLNGNRYDVPSSLLSWLPVQDWGPVLRVIERQPDLWLDAAKSLRDEVSKTPRLEGLVCAIDHAQGFLCGGGIQYD